MTRDEATEIIQRHGMIGDPRRFVDAIAALGILKLEEPRKRELVEVLVDHIHKSGGCPCSKCLRESLKATGLKIVEADKVCWKPVEGREYNPRAEARKYIDDLAETRRDTWPVP
jgi:hypothetical protein